MESSTPVTIILKNTLYALQEENMTIDEEDYENRLSIVMHSGLNIHLQILCFHIVSKVQARQCHKFLTKHQSFNRTSLLDNNVFHKFNKNFYCYFSLMHGLKCLKTWSANKKLIYTWNWYIVIQTCKIHDCPNHKIIIVWSILWPLTDNDSEIGL